MSDVTQSREAEQRLVASELATRALADEQAALRRIATLVASEAPPSAVFERVTEEVARLLRRSRAPACCATRTTRARRWSAAGATRAWRACRWAPRSTSTGTRSSPASTAAASPARIDNYDDAPGALAEHLRGFGYRSSVAAPVSVGARLWGVLVASTTESERLVSGSERRLSDFAELVAQALSNADAYDKLAGSRARIVEAGDAERRRLERNLHDGAQQRLVSLALQLRMVEGEPRGQSRPCPPGSGRGSRAAQARARGAARAGPRHPSRDPHRRRPGPRPLGARPPRAAAGRDRRRCPTNACPSPSRPRPTTSSPRRSPTSPSTPTPPTSPSACCATTGASSSASPTMASAEPTRGRARASTVSPTVSRRSTGNFSVDSPPGGGTRLEARIPVG